MLQLQKILSDKRDRFFPHNFINLIMHIFFREAEKKQEVMYIVHMFSMQIRFTYFRHNYRNILSCVVRPTPIELCFTLYIPGTTKYRKQLLDKRCLYVYLLSPVFTSSCSWKVGFIVI